MFKDAEVSNRRQGEEMWAVLAFMYEPIIILLILDYERIPANSLIQLVFGSISIQLNSHYLHCRIWRSIIRTSQGQPSSAPRSHVGTTKFRAFSRSGPSFPARTVDVQMLLLSYIRAGQFEILGVL
jgi:hypothetical protein